LAVSLVHIIIFIASLKLTESDNVKVMQLQHLYLHRWIQRHRRRQQKWPLQV